MNSEPKIDQVFKHKAYGECRVLSLTTTVGGRWAVYARTRAGAVVFVVWDDVT